MLCMYICSMPNIDINSESTCLDLILSVFFYVTRAMYRDSFLIVDDYYYWIYSMVVCSLIECKPIIIIIMGQLDY